MEPRQAGELPETRERIQGQCPAQIVSTLQVTQRIQLVPHLVYFSLLPVQYSLDTHQSSQLVHHKLVDWWFTSPRAQQEVVQRLLFVPV